MENFNILPKDLEKALNGVVEPEAAEDSKGPPQKEKVHRDVKAKLNNKLLSAILRRLYQLNLTATEEERVLIYEILDDLEQLMILNKIGLELLRGGKK